MADLYLKSMDIPATGNTYKLVQPDGYYPDMTAGQITTNIHDTNSVPYVFRPTPFNSTRESGDIVGASVPWNQLFAAQTFTNTNTDTRSYVQVMLKSYTGNVTIMGSSNVQATGKFEKLFTALASSTGGLKLIHNGSSQNFNFATTASDSIEGHKYYIGATFTGVDPTTVGGTSAKEFMLVDLTLALGSAVADYIYALGNTNNAGINKLREWGFFTKPYYAYNAGSIESVNVSKHKMTGLNQWDEEWEQGAVSALGNKVPSTNDIRSKNYIRVFPNTTYYIKSRGNVIVNMYDEQKNFINYVKYGASNATFTTRKNGVDGYYILFSTYGSSYGSSTYNHDICINISNPAINGTYEPYTVNEYPLDSDLTLRGILKLDGSNNLYADGDVYEADGTVTRKYGVVDMGGLEWAATTTNTSGTYRMRGTFTTAAKAPSANSVIANIACGKYAAITATDTSELVTGISIDNNGYIRVYDPNYNTSSSASAFKTAMDGVYLVYELATPTTETADPFQSPQVCSPYGTEEFVDAGVAAGTRDVAIPVGHNTSYAKNIVGAIEGIPLPPSANGTYTLKVTVASGVPTYSWVSG